MLILFKLIYYNFKLLNSFEIKIFNLIILISLQNFKLLFYAILILGFLIYKNTSLLLIENLIHITFK